MEKESPEELEEESEDPPERMTTAEERREQLSLETVPVSAVCVRFSGTPPPYSARLTPAERGNPNEQNELANQPIYTGSTELGTSKKLKLLFNHVFSFCFMLFAHIGVLRSVEGVHEKKDQNKKQSMSLLVDKDGFVGQGVARRSTFSPPRCSWCQKQAPGCKG